MSNSKKIFIGILSIIFSGSIGSVVAQEVKTTVDIKDPAILFKIHDIKPISDSNGIITSCDFLITFFNRSEESISGASMELIWEDQVITELQDEPKDATAKRASNRAFKNMVSTNIEVPAIKSMQQSVVRSRLQSDRCFLLTGVVNTRIKSCNIASQARGGTRSANVCSSLFRAVYPNNAEYYRDFSPISLDDEMREQTSEKEKLKRDINEEYGKTVAEFEKAAQLLRDIK